MSARLRVGVPAALVGLAPVGGHGKVWHRVLAALRSSATVLSIDPETGSVLRPLARRPAVILADGHADLPATELPLVVQVHEAGWFEPALRELIHPEFLDFIASRTDRALRAAVHSITPSEAARQDLIGRYGLDPARVHAIHHGVDPVFTASATVGPQLVARAGAGRELVARARGGSEAPYVLYAATLHPRKNLALLRDAMAKLVSEGAPHVLAIAGGPAPDRPDSSELERAASSELPGAPGRVVRLGEPTDQELAALMAGADAFCLPSLYEGFGLTVLEAMACGAPVVVSNRGALPEVVGDAGLVVEPTVAALTSALRTVLTDRTTADRLGLSAATRAREFTWERTAAGWLAVLRAASGRTYTRAS